MAKFTIPLFGATLFACLPAAAALAAPETPPLPTSATGGYLAGMIASGDHDSTAAEIYDRAALQGDPGDPALLQRAFVSSLEAGDMRAAFDLARRVGDAGGATALAKLALAVEAFGAGRFSDARKALADPVATAGGGDVTGAMLVAWSYAASHDLKGALATLDKLGDSNFAAFRDFHAGLIADMLGDRAEAEKRLRAAYGLDQNTLRLTEAYASFMDRTGRAPEALRALQAFSDKFPHNPLIGAEMAQIKAGRRVAPLVSD
ncbi:MAG: hypothetical protein KGQ28_08980, partial [Hyphomicrobiales bacterium]|nr:hypothetical protein [Hyphomicrobiales bacterium]